MQVVLGCGSMNGANLGCFMLPSPWKKILSFLCEEGLRIISLPCDNSSGKLEAVDLPKLGFFCVLLAQESKSTEFRIVVSVQPLCAAGLPKLCSQAADWPPPAARLPAASATCARMQRAACSACCLTSRISPSFFAQILPRRKKLLHG